MMVYLTTESAIVQLRFTTNADNTHTDFLMNPRCCPRFSNELLE